VNSEQVGLESLVEAGSAVLTSAGSSFHDCGAGTEKNWDLAERCLIVTLPCTWLSSSQEIQQQMAAQKMMEVFNQVKPPGLHHSPGSVGLCVCVCCLCVYVFAFVCTCVCAFVFGRLCECASSAPSASWMCPWSCGIPRASG